MICRCPYCNSDEIVGDDLVCVDAYIREWIIGDDGFPEAVWTGHSEVLYDTQYSADPNKPYRCADCAEQLSAEELLIESDTDEEEIV